MERSNPATTAKAPPERFTGDVYVTPVTTPTPPSRLTASTVHFTPGARTNWHSHAVGQTLFVTEGEGFVGTRDGRVLRIRPGETIWTPPGEDHWHGATATCLMSHIALVESGDDGVDPTTWLEPVSDDDYRAANEGTAS